MRFEAEREAAVVACRAIRNPLLLCSLLNLSSALGLARPSHLVIVDRQTEEEGGRIALRAVYVEWRAGLPPTDRPTNETRVFSRPHARALPLGFSSSHQGLSLSRGTDAIALNSRWFTN